MSEAPAPRPALRSIEGKEHARPAPARFTDLASELPPAVGRKHRGEEAAAKRKGGKDELVTLKVELPKSVRKELRVRAEQAGYSPEELVYHLVRSWLQR
jgi:hypothetical protein